MRREPVAAIVASSLVLCPASAFAHAFGRMYVLPIPLWIYAYGATATLIVSFAAIGLFVTQTGKVVSGPVESSRSELPPRHPPRGKIGKVGGAVSLALLLLTIATGLWGTTNPTTNFSMTFFWIVVLLGFTYLTALAGDVYAVIGPWRVLCDAIGCVIPRMFSGMLRYPDCLGCWPAFVFYMALIWIELFADFGPRGLAGALLAYSGLTLVGCVAFGKDAWLRQGELFGVFFGLFARMAPVLRAGEDVLRKPFIGLLRKPATDLGMVLFIIFTLSSTAFDGIHETGIWSDLYWKRIWPLLEPLAQGSGNIYAVSSLWFARWQAVMLFASPFVYFAIFMAFIVLTKRAAGTFLGVRELALRFAPALVPIAFVYNVTHYYTLLLTDGLSIIRLASDPFGAGWNLFGTAGMDLPDLLPQAGSIWHFQVGFILLGHVVSVYLSHIEALRLFGEPRRALASQLPMLVLMIGLTTAGLWILSLPIEGGAVIMPLGDDE